MGPTFLGLSFLSATLKPDPPSPGIQIFDQRGRQTEAAKNRKSHYRSLSRDAGREASGLFAGPDDEGHDHQQGEAEVKQDAVYQGGVRELSGGDEVTLDS